MATKLPHPGGFLDDVVTIAGAGLDSSSTRPTNSHLPVLVLKSARHLADYPKTEIVVTVARVVVVASRGTAIPGIVVPGAAAFWLPAPAISIGQTSQRLCG